MSLLSQLLIGIFMIGMTIVFQAIALDFIIRHTKNAEDIFKKIFRPFWQAFTAGIIVMLVFAVHIVHIWMWAVLYRVLDCAPLTNFSDALYFATVAYTTLGYGDIILEPSFRMLGGIEAANGFISFGWTTALIFEVISRLYKREVKSL